MNKPIKPARVLPDQFHLYDATDFDLIPLHTPTATRTKKGKTYRVGKAPIDNNWTKKTYDSPQVMARCSAENRNMGVRLAADDLILDVDPRHGGDVSLRKFVKAMKLDLDEWPLVNTGSGGRHYYGMKPRDLKINTKLAAYPGLEFKTAGSQVVAAGSIHPDTMRPYQVDDFNPPLGQAKEWPANVLQAVKRKPRDSSGEGAGLYAPEQLAAMLARLNVEDFRDEQQWRDLMMACHHATDGNGIEEFIAWSINDPEYSDDCDLIRLRWNSCSSDRADAITAGTLHKALADAGAGDAIPRPDAADDFADAANDEFEEHSDAEWDDIKRPASHGPQDNVELVAMNERYCAVTSGGKYRITYQVRNEKGPDWETMAKQDFLSFFENRRIEGGKGEPKTYGEAWQKWPKRKTAQGVTFDTTLPSGALDDLKRLNLWLGWAVQPKPGRCELFKTMIRDDLCPGEPKAAEYILNWCAWKFQNPGEPPQTAIALRGSKGTGKGTFGEALVTLCGNHGMATSSMEQVVGRFNGHLEKMIVGFLDEALWAGDPRQEGRLKKLVTDRDATYEHKNVRAYTGINRMACVLATNDDWVVPATEGERRYCVTRTSDKHQCPEGDPTHPNRAYWDAIHAELKNGGLAAFLHEMLNRRLPAGWHPRAHVPLTQELANQKARSLKGIVGYYFTVLQAGRPPDTIISFDNDDDWSKPLMVSPTRFWEACDVWMKMESPHARVTMRAVSKELKRFGWKIGSHQHHGKDRARYWLCPSLAEARTAFEAIMKGRMFD